jgi:hypothetical protein
MQESTPDLAAEVGEVLDQEDLGLRQGDVKIIVALLKTSTRWDAARLAKVSERTLYRRLRNPKFRRALDMAEKLFLQEVAWNASDADGADVDCESI